MGKNKDGIIILLVIFVLMGLAWDPAKRAAQNNSSSNSSTVSPYPTVAGESSYGSNKEVTEADVIDEIKKSQYTLDQIQKNLDKQELERNKSPYYGKVSVSYPAYLNDPDPSREYMTITASLDRGEKVDITGWVFKSSRSGNTATIGTASVLPFPFTKGSDRVILRSSDRAYIIKGFSPIGISFRANKCTGYFGQDRTFYPYLSQSCPLPKDENLPQFSNILDRDDECKDYISRLQRCRVPNGLNRLPDTITSSCKTYLETQINYNSCVATHKNDVDFPGQEWYVYLNRFGPLWRDKHETINLYDQNGLIVYQIKYDY